MATSIERHIWKQLTQPKFVGWEGLVAIYSLLLGSQFTLAMSAAAVDMWFCVTRAPTVCGASTRKSLRCSLNGKGLLRGCGIQQHSEQRVEYLRDRDWAEVRAHFRRNVITSTLLMLSALALVVSFCGLACATCLNWSSLAGRNWLPPLPCLPRDIHSA